MKKRKGAVNIADVKAVWREIMRECRGIILKKMPEGQKKGMTRPDYTGFSSSEAKTSAGWKQ